MHPVALVGAAAGRLAHYAVSGVVGALIVKSAAKRLPEAKPAARKAVVGGLVGGIVAGRWLASAAEEARLKAGDVLAEARTSLGEEVPPPSAVATEGNAHDHEH
ncbi:uncharacterized protein DUF1490 [Streptomyces sp. 2333.5]|uniref:DUF1490 family protein n=1 Tax=unclassified Streptomyces TaxID=2593676 RepID=UPI000899922F|nr:MULTISPECIES: DUF1490 family protein [unclassified Streptomyces]PJJ05994.1 uncharacterized protein DUF1490 [Streptomyces sp. 2333.5]SEE88281.1 Protein of unknown function [Streptomyces sp. 2314.4]SEF05825.1 Protein of unknown function [Streptomyces sp. 2112.2]